VFVSPASGASLEILVVPPPGSDGEILVRRRLVGQKTRPATHVHLDVVERFMIEQGVAEAKLDADTLRLAGGDVLLVPKTVPHAVPFSRDRGVLVMRQSFQPATEGARAYFRTLGQMLEDGRDDGGELPRLASLAVVSATGARAYMTRVPFWSQRKLLVPAGAHLARARGYDVWLTR
jgi:mannose-6-phosphate isomerase-like protein (cupin superfamily)